MSKNLKFMYALPCLLLTLMIVSACNEKDESAPVVQTGEITLLDDSLFVVTAAILNDPGNIIEYGFVWGNDPDNGAAKKISCGSIPISEVYESRIGKEDILTALVEYRVRAFVRTDAKTFYGREVKFLSIAGSGPRINYFEPDSGTWGDTVSIYGYNFLDRPGSAAVSIGTVNLTLEKINDSLAVVVIPSTLNQLQAAFEVTNSNKATISENKFILLPPVLEGVSPDSATVGTSLDIRGKRFSSKQTYVSVSVDGKKVTCQLKNDSLITFIMPAGITSTEPEISLKVLGQEATEKLYTHLANPIIKTVTPLAWPGDQITVTGKFFGPSTPVYSKVFVNGLQCNLNQVSDTLIKAILPLNVVPGPATVKVTTETRFTEVTGQLDIYGPIPTGIEPQQAAYGDEVVISGSRFTQYGEISVSFDEFAATITEISDDFIRVIVPNTISREHTKIRFKAGDRTLYTSTTFNLSLPVIQDVNPKQFTFLDTITITGNNFNPDPATSSIYIGTSLCTVIDCDREQIRAIVPVTWSTATGGAEVVRLLIYSSINSYGPAIDLITPEVSAVNPTSVTIGDTLEVTGNFFNPVPSKNVVMLGTKELSVITGSSTVLLAIADHPSSGEYNIAVKAGNKISIQPTPVTIYNPFSIIDLLKDGQVFGTKRSMIAFMVGNQLIAGQGEYFSITSSAYFSIDPEIPKQISSFTIATNNLTYGAFSFSHLDQDYALSNKQLFKYDKAIPEFSIVSQFPGGAIRYQSGFVIGDKLYVGTGTNAAAQTLDEFWEYDLVSGVWTRKASFPGGPIAVGTGFAIFGKGYMGFGSPVQKNLYEYDPGTDTWSFKCQIPDLVTDIDKGRYALVSIAVGGKAIVGLGRNSTVSAYGDLYSYDPAENSWVKLKELGAGIKLSYPTMITDGEFGYIIGGYGIPRLQLIKFKISDL